MNRAADRTAAPSSFTQDNGAVSNSCSPPDKQDLPPLERYGAYLPHDKRVWFELARIHLLAGRWQGPGNIAQLRLAARWRT